MLVLYLSHGAPPLVDDALWVSQLAEWAGKLPTPSAILVISAHWETREPTVITNPRPPMLYDYYGFPDAAYSITWPAPGAP